MRRRWSSTVRRRGILAGAIIVCLALSAPFSAARLVANLGMVTTLKGAIADDSGRAARAVALFDLALAWDESDETARAGRWAAAAYIPGAPPAPAVPPESSPAPSREPAHLLWLGDARRVAGDASGALAAWRSAGAAPLFVQRATVVDGAEQSELLRRAALVDPANAGVHAILAENAAAREDWPGAIDELERAVALAPENTAYLSRLGQLRFYRLGDRDRSIQLVLRAQALDPRDGWRATMLGDFYRISGDCATALRWYDRALELLRPYERSAVERLLPECGRRRS